jgi:hypothetical protein
MERPFGSSGVSGTLIQPHFSDALPPVRLCGSQLPSDKGAGSPAVAVDPNSTHTATQEKKWVERLFMLEGGARTPGGC